MRHVSFSSSCFFLFLFLFFFLILLTPKDDFPATSALSVDDIVNKTCLTCSNKSSVFDYSFCSASLQEVPVSHAANLHGLAIVAMELALQNATNTLSMIKELLINNKTSSPSSLACLTDCSQLYSDAIGTMMDAVAAFLTGQYGNCNVWVSAVMEAATTCEEGFQEMEEESSPLTKENYGLFQLCDVALCIINLVASSDAYLLKS